MADSGERRAQLLRAILERTRFICKRLSQIMWFFKGPPVFMRTTFHRFRIYLERFLLDVMSRATSTPLQDFCSVRSKECNFASKVFYWWFCLRLVELNWVLSCSWGRTEFVDRLQSLFHFGQVGTFAWKNGHSLFSLAAPTLLSERFDFDQQIHQNLFQHRDNFTWSVFPLFRKCANLLPK